MAHLIYLAQPNAQVHWHSTWLRTQGHEVTVVESTEAFEEIFRPGTHHIVVTTDPYAFVKAMRLPAAPLSDEWQTGLVYLSIPGQMEHHQAYLLGADHCLPQTVCAKELAAVVKAMLRWIPGSQD